VSEGAAAYLDNNATTSISPAAAARMAELLRGAPGNPASPHGLGAAARDILEEARACFARHLGGAQVIFTSGATEANALALLGALQHRQNACEDARFRFLAAAYGRINSTWTLPNQVGWPIAKELLFTARIVEAEEAYRIGLLNHLVPRDQLRAKTMELARMIAGNNRAAVMGIKTLLLKQMTQSLEEQWAEERHFTTHVVGGAKAEDAFPEFIARHGRPLA
jgi:Enoyl-CoA hydratase/isomerase/Aminotransferase class-V